MASDTTVSERDVARGQTYERIGAAYNAHRRPDPRIAARIDAALGDARRIVNVGAGTGAYEPRDRDVLAVEPSPTMIAQRPSDAAPVVRARAEALPLRDRSFDAALASLTLHHWSDEAGGIAEMQRVARRQVFFTFDLIRNHAFWLVRDYLPEAHDYDRERTGSLEALRARLGTHRVEIVPVPHDCVDGFQAAYWRRPEAYFDPTVRANISSIAALPAPAVARALEHLRADLESGRWHARNRALLDRDEIDVGYRLVVAEGGRS